jgi:hypothetical protein
MEKLLHRRLADAAAFFVQNARNQSSFLRVLPRRMRLPENNKERTAWTQNKKS